MGAAFLFAMRSHVTNTAFVAPQQNNDTVYVLNSNRTTIKKAKDSTSLLILEGNVVLKQGNTIFKCNRCIKNDNARTFEAWGTVHINDSDTTNIYAGHLRYLTDRQYAYLDQGVRLTDGHGTLTTPDLEYDMSTRIANYKNGGKVVNKKTVITSKEGYYYTDLKDVFFKKDVVVTDPQYHITADSLQYNTESQVARFISNTTIKDPENRNIKTREGYYNLRSGIAEFGQRSTVSDDKSSITADSLALDNDFYQAKGNAIIKDTVRGTTIIANLIYQRKSNEAVLATQNPLMIVKQSNDSIYITADTLFSAKLSDLGGYVDKSRKVDTTLAQHTTKAKQKTDSTDRYFEAYRNVKIFSDSLQAVSDSLFYSFKDSVFRLYQNPVVWGKGNQMTGDTIHLYTLNKQPREFQSINNALMVNLVEEGVFNQIKSSRMDGYFTEGALDSLRAKGSAECIYYLQDDDSAYTGVNQSTCDAIDVYLQEKQLKKIVFRSNVEGTIYPMKQKSASEMRLQNFKWLEARRPKTKFDLMQY